MQAEYVVVGSGSGGAAVAARLAEAGRSVLVIEAGGSDVGPFIRMPGALSYPMNMARYDWGFRSLPEPALGGRRLACPRGKVLGGSSSINGMVWVRGHARDYDHWAEAGAEGWAFADVLPYFRRLESWHGAEADGAEVDGVVNGSGEGPSGASGSGAGGEVGAAGRVGAAAGAGEPDVGLVSDPDAHSDPAPDPAPELAPDPAWRGRSGPVHITRGPRSNPLFGAFIASGRQAGYPVTPDYNGRQQEGFGAMEASIWQGRRWSTAMAYLRPAQAQSGLRLVRAEALRVVFEGRRAIGVEVRRRGRTEVIRATREVILAASAINTPKLLMLSGIGPAAHLAAHGIDVLADRPGVGGNLQDHLEVYVQYASAVPVTLYRYWNLLGKAWVGAQWLLAGRGPGASNQFEACGFIRSRAGVDYPDIQFHFLPLAVRYDGRAAVRGHGFQVHVGPMRSPSRGTVRLASPRPEDAPEIRFNYMSQPQDWEDFRACLRLTREIMAQPAMAPFVARELSPGPEAVSDAALDDFVREHAESAYHPCGTARMGRADDPEAVVDPQGRVIGVEALRVADSSVFPRITNGNLNAPSILVGEKMADHILGRPPLPRENLEPWVHPDWRTAQR